MSCITKYQRFKDRFSEVDIWSPIITKRIVSRPIITIFSPSVWSLCCASRTTDGGIIFFIPLYVQDAWNLLHMQKLLHADAFDLCKKLPCLCFFPPPVLSSPCADPAAATPSLQDHTWLFLSSTSKSTFILPPIPELTLKKKPNPPLIPHQTHTLSHPHSLRPSLSNTQ